MFSRRTPLIAAVVVSIAHSADAQAPERVRPNDNRARAGVQGANALAIRMEAKLAMWHPNGDDKPGALIPVFAELGRAPQVPGPLIRAPGGTDVIIMVRNSIPNATLVVHGLHARPPIVPAGTTFSDSVVIAPGTFQTLRFKLDRPGTYYYWGSTTGRTFDRRGEDAQLSGAIVVDEPGERTPRDRIFVIGMWTDTTAGATAPDSVRHRQRELVVLNGRAWPAGDRVQYERGDVVRWRVINASVDAHPMHLHGFYYRVLRRGDAMVDTVLATRSELVHTERVAAGGTYSATFSADRLGAWLFHCEDPAHYQTRGPLGFPAPTFVTANGSVVTRPMGGLATAVEVSHAEGDTSWKLPPPLPPYPARRYRMLLRPNLGSSASTSIYGIALTELGIEAPPPDSGQRVGPTMVLNRAEPVSVWVVNNLPEPTAITWHGIEGESINDGVPGVSGVKPVPLPRNAPPPVTPPKSPWAPLIAPNDSFEVRLAPPKAGTFAYHAIVSPSRQMNAGLVGAIVVSERNKYDAALNIPIVISSPSDSATDEHAVLMNGSTTPALLDLRRGGTFRVRAMNFTTARPDIVLELRQQDTTFAAWRPAARDGIELLPADRVLQPARATLSTGQIRDFEFQPIRSGDYRFEARTPSGIVLGVWPVRVY